MVALLPAHAAAAAEGEVPAPKQPPEWFLEHIEFITRDGGRWIADNGAYRGSDEPFEAYGMVWERGIGGMSLKGRLFGLQNGEEVGPFWEFRSFWHPERNRVLAYQFGNAALFGAGPMVATGERSHRSEQTFYQADGGTFTVGHESREAEDGSYETASFDILADGSWTPRRRYVWRLQQN